MSVASIVAASDRIARMRTALAVLAPSELELTDESHLHAGHAGAQSGRGHFRVRVVSVKFSGLAPLARHREVYAALGPMMQTDIHALSLQTLTPAEALLAPGRIDFTVRGSK